MSKTWKITLDEDELRSLIQYHSENHAVDPSVETSARIHDLTKRLHKKDEAETVEEKPTENVKEVVIPSAWG